MAPVVEGEFPVEQLRATKRSFSPFFLCLSQMWSQAPVEQTRESLKRAINEQVWVVNECAKVCKTDPARFGAGQILRPFFQSTRSIFGWHQEAATMGDSRMVAWHDFAPLLSGRPGAFPRRCRKWSCWSGTRGLAVCHVAGRCKGLELIFACARSMQEYHRGHFGWQEVYSILVPLRTL